MSNRLATTFALTVASLFVGGCEKNAPESETPAVADQPDSAAGVRCYGVNECAGQTACDVSGKSDCAGNNECCGKGWLYVSKVECDARGGGQDQSFIENVAGACAKKSSVDTPEE